MADETKKYLINIESNLKQYAQEAADAKKRVDELKTSNEALKKSGASPTEIEASNAALRNANKEYSNAKKVMDLATLANKAQVGSYEQLYRQHQLLQTALKLEEGLMVRNADGTYKMTDKYIRLSKEVDNAKKGLDKFGKGIHDNRLNVGNYSEVLQGAIGKFQALPGPIGRAASSANTFVTSLAKAGPVGLLVAGAVMAISTPLFLFFTKSEKGMDMLEEKVAGVKAAFRVLAGEMIDLGDKATEGLNKPAKEGLSWWSKLLIAIGGPKWTATAVAMDSASTAAENYTKMIHELEDAENALIVPRAESNLKLKEARILYADITKSSEVRRNALKEAIDLENTTADNEIKHQERVRDNLKLINEEKRKANMLTRADERKLQEAEARIIDLRSESIGREIKNTMRIATLDKEMLADKLKLIQAEEKFREIGIKMEIDSYKAQKSALKSAYDEQTAEVGHSYDEREQMRKDYEANIALLDMQSIAKQKTILAEQLEIQLKEVDTIIQPERLAAAQRLVIKRQYDEAYTLLDDQANQEQAKRDQAERDRKKKVSDDDIKAGFEAQRIISENKQIGAWQDLDFLNTILDAEYGQMLASVEYEKMTSNQKLLIEAEYNNAKKQLSEARVDQIYMERQVVADAFGAMADLLGKNTILGKAMGIAQATINTWIAASKALAEYPPPLNFIAMGTAIAAGLMTVANIVRVKVPNKNVSDTSSAPSAITAAPAAQRAFAPSAGSTILQPQLSQAQLNAIPNSGALNATDIASAIGKEFEKLPAPVVTVEDINARTKSVQKVTVRANI